jgi:lysophospholipase L1-like esterase
VAGLMFYFPLVAVRDRIGPIYVQEPGHEQTGHKYLYDEHLGWRNIPNWKATTFGHSLTINSKGLRDREYPYQKPPGTMRILVLGDSYAWGYGVADNQVFSEVLEAKFEQTGSKIEVLNSGVSGWGTDQEYLFLVDEGIKYAPDLVVLAFFVLNDMDDNSHSMQYGLYKPVFLNLDLELANVPVPKPDEKVFPLQTHADPWDLTVSIMEKMSAVCEEHDCRLVVMKFGTFLIEDPVESKEIDQVCQERISPLSGVLYFDLDQEFAAQKFSLPQLLEGNDDDHWNAFGHRQTAMALFQFLVDQKLVPVDAKPEIVD